MSERFSPWKGVWFSLQSWRTASVSLLSFSSGLPLGLVWITIPAWMAREGVDIKVIGLFTLAQAPWTFKFIWSPFMDRFTFPFPKVGRKIGWTLFFQAVLFFLTVALGGIPFQADWVWIVAVLTLAMAFASASQDIAIDAYAVEVLRPEEQGTAVGARIAIYRAAMFIAGGVAITLGGNWSWRGTFVLLGCLYLPLMLVSWFSPKSEVDEIPPPQSLRAAVWEPFLGFLSVHRSIQILSFVVFYKLADNLAGALIRPFLIQTGFNDFDVGIATATIGLFATLGGTFLGGVLTTAWGLGHSLWIFGTLQILSNFGYVLVAEVGVNRPLMYGAMGFEALTTGMGTGAFSVLLLRMTQKRFSATQYALFSSLFALPRIFSGPVTGVMVDAVGWGEFFLFTMAVGIPGMILLHQFSPLGVREPSISEEARKISKPIPKYLLLFKAGIGGFLAFVSGVAATVILSAFKIMQKAPEKGFDLGSPLGAFFSPDTLTEWSQLIGCILFALIIALATAATYAARSGQGEVPR